jgi:hypothetical protein
MNIDRFINDVIEELQPDFHQALHEFATTGESRAAKDAIDSARRIKRLIWLRDQINAED